MNTSESIATPPVPPLPESTLPSQVPWTWRDIGMVLLITLVSTIVFGIGMAAWLQLADGDIDHLNATLTVVLGSAIYVALIGAVYWRTVRRYGVGWGQLGVKSFGTRWLMLMPLLLFIMWIGVGLANLLIVVPLAGVEFENPQVAALAETGPLTALDFGLLFLMIAVAAPIAEELFFRGMLYPLLRKRLAVWPTIIINGLVFSLIHVFPVLLPALTVMGFMLTWVRYRTDSVLACILLHMLQNTIASLAIYNLLLAG